MCDLCKGKGYLPLIRNGNMIPYVFIDCQCKNETPEKYHERLPSDFDFPCSDTWRGYFYELNGFRDPARNSNLTIINHPEKVRIIRESNPKVTPPTKSGYKDISA
jgi:hypothetical protein